MEGTTKEREAQLERERRVVEAQYRERAKRKSDTTAKKRKKRRKNQKSEEVSAFSILGIIIATAVIIYTLMFPLAKLKAHGTFSLQAADTITLVVAATVLVLSLLSLRGKDI